MIARHIKGTHWITNVPFANERLMVFHFSTCICRIRHSVKLIFGKSKILFCKNRNKRLKIFFYSFAHIHSCCVCFSGYFHFPYNTNNALDFYSNPRIIPIDKYSSIPKFHFILSTFISIRSWSDSYLWKNYCR